MTSFLIDDYIDDKAYVGYWIDEMTRRCEPGGYTAPA